jgi:hypothetical protein
LKRFAREAQILGLLHHPGIASIYEAGVSQDGQPPGNREKPDDRCQDDPTRRRKK